MRKVITLHWSKNVELLKASARIATYTAGLLLVMLAFTLGLWTQVSSVLTWLAMLSYIQRSTISLFGLDTMMVIVTLYLMIGPSGAALSVDRFWMLYRARRAAGGHREMREGQAAGHQRLAFLADMRLRAAAARPARGI